MEFQNLRVPVENFNGSKNISDLIIVLCKYFHFVISLWLKKNTKEEWQLYKH